MKKLLISIILFFTLSIGISSAEEAFDLEGYKEEICEYLGTARGYNGTDFDSSEILIDEAYVVKILKPLMITEYKKAGDLNDIVSDEWDYVRIEVPFKNYAGSISIISLAYEDGNLRELGRKVAAPEAGNSGYIFLPSDAMSVIETELNDVTRIEFFKNQMYYTTLVYVSAGNSEYVIPYFEGSYDMKAFENGTVYPVKEFFDLMDKEFDEDYILENPDNDGGVPLRDDTGNSVIKPYSEDALKKINAKVNADETVTGDLKTDGAVVGKTTNNVKDNGAVKNAVTSESESGAKGYIIAVVIACAGIASVLLVINVIRRKEGD